MAEPEGVMAVDENASAVIGEVSAIVPPLGLTIVAGPSEVDLQACRLHPVGSISSPRPPTETTQGSRQPRAVTAERYRSCRHRTRGESKRLAGSRVIDQRPRV